MNKFYKDLEFTDVWNNVDDFVKDYKDADGGLNVLPDEAVKLTFYLLFANYGSSHINTTFLTQWKYKVFSKMFSLGPTWYRRLEVQKMLRELDLNDPELFKTAKSIYNNASNGGGR